MCRAAQAVLLGCCVNVLKCVLHIYSLLTYAFSRGTLGVGFRVYGLCFTLLGWHLAFGAWRAVGSVLRLKSSFWRMACRVENRL